MHFNSHDLICKKLNLLNLQPKSLKVIKKYNKIWKNTNNKM